MGIRMRRAISAGLTLLLIFAMALGAAAADKARKDPPSPKPAVQKEIYDAPMRVVIVQNDRGCSETCPQWIAAEGEITTATPGAFARVFKQMGNRKLPVLIRSSGGSIEAAFEIGRMIRIRGLDVAVGFTVYRGCAPDQKDCKLPAEQKGIFRGSATEYYAWCNSACHLVLASGTRRIAAYGSYVGVHKPKKTFRTGDVITYRERYRIVNGQKKVVDRKVVDRKAGKSKVTFGMDAELRNAMLAYYRTMGIDEGLLAENNAAEFTGMNYLTADKLDKFRLRTTRESTVVLLGGDICKKKPAPSYCQPLIGGAQRKQPQQQAALPPDVPLPEDTSPPSAVGNRYDAMEFSLLQTNSPVCKPRCPQWIVARGRISVGTTERFLAFLAKQKPKPVAVMLDSLGGDGRESMKLGRVFRKERIATLIGISAVNACDGTNVVCQKRAYAGFYKAERPMCQFECTLLFMAGTVRIMDRNSDLLFRDLRLRKIEVPGQLDDVTPMIDYLKEMGAREALVGELQAAVLPPMQGDEALAKGVATAVPNYVSAYFKPEACADPALGIFCRK